MNKKTYIAPSMKVRKVDEEALMAASPTTINGTTNPASVNNTPTTDAARSKGFLDSSSDWADDEE